jgi:hypothetical protein
MSYQPPNQPQDPYGQPPQNPYGQPPQNPYGQPPQNPYGQPPQNPYGQQGGYPPQFPQYPPYGQPPKRNSPLKLILLVGGGLLGICLIIGVLTLLGKRVEDPKQAATRVAEGAVIKATDGQSQITAPDDWKVMPELNDVAELEAGNEIKEQYLIVLTEPQSDIDGDLQHYADLVVDNIRSSVEGPNVSKSKPIKINGQPALQYTISGTVDKIEAIYLLTLVEGKTNYYQIISWTLGSMEDENLPLLEEVTKSFREI